MEIKYGYTILYVADVELSISFYKNVFGFDERMMTPEKDYAELNTGNTVLAFASVDLGNSNFKKGFQKSTRNDLPFGIELGFITMDVQAFMDKAVQQGGSILEPLERKPWGQDVGYILDIDGFIVELGSPIPGH